MKRSDSIAVRARLASTLMVFVFLTFLFASPSLARSESAETAYKISAGSWMPAGSESSEKDSFTPKNAPLFIIVILLLSGWNYRSAFSTRKFILLRERNPYFLNTFSNAP